MQNKYIRFLKEHKEMHFNGSGDAYDYCIATSSYDIYKKGKQFRIIKRAPNNEGWIIKVKHKSVYIDDYLIRDKIVEIIFESVDL